ncbi:MAG: archease [Thermoleophilia bacterium]|nr:archease [Thermoleophilia bacterium]
MPEDAAPPASGFELTEHTADFGVRAWAPRREDVFAQAARGMLSLVCDPSLVAASERYEFAVEAPDECLLLAAWLNELLYFVEGRGVVFSGAFELWLGAPQPAAGEGAQFTLRALAAGEPRDPARHAVRGVVKAATLHRLSFDRIPGGGWEGHVLLDV